MKNGIEMAVEIIANKIDPIDLQNVSASDAQKALARITEAECALKDLRAKLTRHLASLKTRGDQ
jgi:hypothetical protein